AAMLVKLVVRTPRKHAELVSSVLFEAGAGGIEERDGAKQLLVYAADRETAEGIATRARALLHEVAPGENGIALSIEVDENSDWASAWTQHLGQIALTPSLVIQPEWDETPAPPGTRRILFDPKLSFGDGAHPTTRLASVALERACRTYPSSSVLDFGSGTGVLAFVALLSGAQDVLGTDIDPVSVEAAERNAQLNALSRRCRFCLPALVQERTFDLVVANLEAPTLLSVFDELVRHARGAKRLILTGFLAAKEAEIVAAFEANFRREHVEYEEDWALLELVPAP
ncbi:MAG TPA: 50S ribosomal protein L11 methyltransferase, partial [Polyangiaceae bacterium]|nr:50S ribosomal protein L11 methyltransferase [Polyangiaceae bacterium]